eukprot:758773-Hanusia_phi.AAC.1
MKEKEIKEEERRTRTKTKRGEDEEGSGEEEMVGRGAAAFSFPHHSSLLSRTSGMRTSCSTARKVNIRLLLLSCCYPAPPPITIFASSPSR